MLSDSYYCKILQDSEKRLSRMCSIFTIAVHVGQCLKETADKVKEREKRSTGRERGRRPVLPLIVLVGSLCILHCDMMSLLLRIYDIILIACIGGVLPSSISCRLPVDE